MRKLQIAVISAFLFSLPGCSNSRLRKDFVATFKSDWPAHCSPFAKKCEKAGEKLADGVNKVGAKFDDAPIEERCGHEADKLSNNARDFTDKAKDKSVSVADSAKDGLKQAKDEDKSCFKWLRTKSK